MNEPASVAQFDACPTGDQEVGCEFDPCRVGNILSWILIMIYFLWSFSPLLIQEGKLSVSGKRMYMYTIMVNA